ncbi:unnamed protein product [Symbiodinium necroappetens]|uniref:2'-phosphotransferase n=1 Tax=Symbiodinium necroappetens TaxID=1628268 RepID=A0A813A524_9DINO|nr:unnamed protein product [Symbiodinium necroappetens]
MASKLRLGLVVVLFVLLRPRQEAWSTVRRATREASASRGRVAIVTGASTGLGLATAQSLATSGNFSLIVLAGRSQEKHEKALDSLRQLTPVAELRYMPLELDSLASVRGFVVDFLAMKLPLHCLVLNAGVMALPSRQETRDGHEYQLAVNYLGHFLLANLLVDHMAATASPRDPGRIISLSSSAHLIPSALQRGDLSDLQSADKYAPWQAYGQAKLCNLLFAYELDRRCRLGGIPIASNAIHPGAVATELKRHLPQNQQEEDQGQNPLEGVYQALKSVVQPLLDLIVQSPEEGARTTVLLATSEQGKLSGYYWQDGRPSASLDTEVQGLLPPPLRALRILSRLLKAVAPPEKAATSYDTETWRELWRESERLVGLEASEKPAVFAGLAQVSQKQKLLLVDVKRKVWKPRRLFADTPSGNLRELSETDAPTDQVLWVEPPWAPGSVLAGGLTSHHQMGPMDLAQAEPRDLLCYTPAAFPTVASGAMPRSLDERSLMPVQKLHLTMAVLTLRSEQDVQAAKLGLANAAAEFAKDYPGPLHFRLCGLDSDGDTVLFAKVRPEDEASLRSLHRRIQERMLAGEGAVASTSSPVAEPEQNDQEQITTLSNEKLSRIEGNTFSSYPLSMRVLRHDAVRLGLPLRSDGSVGLQELLALPFFKSNGFVEKDVEAEVRCNNKQRFQLWTEDGAGRIRASQGHKMKEVVDSELLQPVQRAEDLPICIHGTYFTKWSPKKKCQVQVWSQIKQAWLSGDMERSFSMPKDCAVAIYLDVPKALEQGIKLYRSANDVILTRGDESGRIPPALFQRVVEIKSGRCLWPVEEPCADTTDSETAEEVRRGSSAALTETSVRAGSLLVEIRPDMDMLVGGLADGLEASSAKRTVRIVQEFRDTDLGPVVVDRLELCRMKADGGGAKSPSARSNIFSKNGRSAAEKKVIDAAVHFSGEFATASVQRGNLRRGGVLLLIFWEPYEPESSSLFGLIRERDCCEDAPKNKQRTSSAFRWKTSEEEAKSQSQAKYRRPGQAAFTVVAVSGKILFAGSLPGCFTVRELKAKLGQVEEQRLLHGTRSLDDAELLQALASDEALRLVCVRTLRRLAVSGGSDRGLCLWDLDRGQADCDLVGHTSAILCISVHWPSQRALTGSRDRSVQLWRLSGECLLEMRGHLDAVQCLSADWETNVALSASLDQTLVFWDLDTGEILQELMDHASPAVSLDVDWVGRQALAGAMDGSLQLWDLRSTAAERRNSHQAELRFLRASWNDLQAVSGDPSGRVVLWDLAPLEALRLCSPDGPAITCMSVNPDMREVAAGGIDGTLYFWSCGEVRKRKAIQAHSSAVFVLEVDWAGRSALTSGDDGRLCFWNLILGSCLRVLSGHLDAVSCLVVNWPSAVAISAAADCTLRLWDVGRGLCLRCLPNHRITALEVDWEQQRVLAVGADPVVRLRDVFRRGVCVKELPEYDRTVFCVAVDWAAMHALTGGDECQLILWDLCSSEVLRRFQGHRDAVCCVEADWNGRRCLSGSCDNSLLLWNLDTAEVLLRLAGHDGGARCIGVAWSARQALTGGDDCALRLWDLSTAANVAVLEGHTAAVCGVDLMWQTQQAASACKDATVRIWCLNQRCCTQVLPHDVTVRCLEVDWSSSQLLSGSSDGLVRLWHWSSEDVQEFEGHTGGVTCLSVDWSSGLAISGSADNSLRIWDLKAEDDASDSTLFQVGEVLCVTMGCGPGFLQGGVKTCSSGT